MVQCKRELYKHYQSLEIIRTVEVAQLQWAGHLHLQRMGHCETPRSITDFRLEERTVNRPKLWRIDGVVDDVRKLGIWRWWMVTRDRQLCTRVLQVAEAHHGLWCHWWWWWWQLVHTAYVFHSQFSAKLMFLPLIICIVLFTQTTKMWMYQAKEVMAITASYNKTETLLDCFIDWQVYSWVTPLYAVICYLVI